MNMPRGKQPETMFHIACEKTVFGEKERRKNHTKALAERRGSGALSVYLEVEFRVFIPPVKKTKKKKNEMKCFLKLN